MKASDVAARYALKPYRIDERNVKRAKEDALNYSVAESASSWSETKGSILVFLKEHRSELLSLISTEGVEHAVLDIAIDFPDEIAAKFVRVEHDLLSAISELGLDLEISFYRVGSP